MRPASEEDTQVFQELYHVLEKHNALRRFGITLLHQHFDIADDEVLLETTDLKARIQMIQPVKKKELDGVRHIETSWRLDTGKPVMGCACIDTGSGHNHWPRPSDVRLKEDIKALEVPLDKLLLLNPKTYTYRKGVSGLPTGKQHGLLAQDVEQHFPELVSEVPRGGTTYKAIDYVGLVPLLLGAVQQQQETIKGLSQRLTILEAHSP